jgi:two-component system response regulator NreC
LKAGADGYVLKEASYAELLLAIRKVITGKQYISPEISGRVIDGYLESKKSAQTDSPYQILTKRERQILKLIAEGYKPREIADFLHISLHTVETHGAKLMEKLDIYNTAGLVTFAIGKALVGKEKGFARKTSNSRR